MRNLSQANLTNVPQQYPLTGANLSQANLTNAIIWKLR